MTESVSADSRKQIIEEYLKYSWLLKIRLMSARQYLWGEKFSLVQAEAAILQIRKSCENIAQLTLCLHGIRNGHIPKHVRREWNPEKIFAWIKKNGSIRLPEIARFIEVSKTEDGKNTNWHLELNDPVDGGHEKILEIISRTQRYLHEYNPSWVFPTEDEEAKIVLAEILNGIRRDHQWLWNRFWFHGTVIEEQLFAVDLGDNTRTTCPVLFKQESLIPFEVGTKINPFFFSDIENPVSWLEENTKK